GPVSENRCGIDVALWRAAGYGYVVTEISALYRKLLKRLPEVARVDSLHRGIGQDLSPIEVVPICVSDPKKSRTHLAFRINVRIPRSLVQRLFGRIESLVQFIHAISGREAEPGWKVVFGGYLLEEAVAGVDHHRRCIEKPVAGDPTFHLGAAVKERHVRIDAVVVFAQTLQRQEPSVVVVMQRRHIPQ